MGRKRYIVLLLLAVYLFATGGPACASLSCSCVWEKACTTHVCCHHGADHCIDHSGDAPAAVADVTAPCCGDHHSTEINLYTGSSDNDKLTHCVVLLLPPALGAETCLECLEAATTPDRTAERRTPFLPEGFSAPTGLRAPPVLA